MVILISLVLIIILYYGIRWLYHEYKKDLNDLEKQNNNLQKEINELKRCNMINRQMINWLCDKVANYKLKTKKVKKNGSK